MILVRIAVEALRLYMLEIELVMRIAATVIAYIILRKIEWNIQVRKWRKRTMKIAAFNARCPHEIGDKVQIIDKGQDGALYITEKTITDIACTHYLREGRAHFTYELDGQGKYIQLITVRGQNILKNAYIIPD